jgi:flagellum-specific peptidoglycan hydrolase FlgJ
MVGFNFAGLKGEGPNGISALWWTREGSRMSQTRVLCRFRAYATPQDGARDYVRVLRERFRAALAAAQHGDVKGFVQALARRGFFTDDATSYERSLSSLAREFMRQRLAAEPPA